MVKLFEKKKMQRPVYKVEKDQKAAREQKEDELWVKCEKCSTPLFKKMFLEHLKVCEKCGYHHKLLAYERLAMLIDDGTFQELDRDLTPGDPLGFGKDYSEKLKADHKKTGLRDAILTGAADIGGYKAMVGIMDFYFRGGQHGLGGGRKIRPSLRRRHRAEGAGHHLHLVGRGPDAGGRSGADADGQDHVAHRKALAAPASPISSCSPTPRREAYLPALPPWATSSWQNLTPS